MNIVKQSASVEEIIKKSRFIGIIHPCNSEKEAKRILYELHQQHPHASHIVFAYRILQGNQNLYRFHDAGEPSGTAGKPIFQHLEGKQLINVILVVVRYFGGIKLGAGGLTRAYGHTAKAVMDVAQIETYIPYTEISLTLEYGQINQLEYQLKKLEGKIIEQNFAASVHVKVTLPQKNVKSLMESLN